MPWYTGDIVVLVLAAIAFTAGIIGQNMIMQKELDNMGKKRKPKGGIYP